MIVPAAPLSFLRFPVRFVLAALLLCALDFRTAVATPDGSVSENRRWSDGFGIDEFDAPVYAFAQYQGEIVTSGSFRQASGVPCPFIARWDGKHWRSLGEGFRRPVSALFVNEGFLIAGSLSIGEPEGGPGVRLVGRWDGSSWADMGANLIQASFFSFFLLHGDLCAAGSFRLQGVDLDRPVIRWNGSEWMPVPFPGFPGTTYVKAVAQGDTAYLTTGERIDLWNGSTWKTLVDFGCYLGFCSRVYDIAIHRDDLYAAGDFHLIGGTRAPYLARYRNREWEAVDAASPIDSYAFALCSTDRGLLVSGWFREPLAGATIARWTGDAWERLGDDPAESPAEIAEFDSDIFVGGGFLESGSKRTPYCARWDGAQWSKLEERGGHDGAGLLDPTTVEGMAATGSQLYLVGSLHWRDDHRSAPSLASYLGWDGRRWVFIPDPFAVPRGVIASWQDRLLAAGVTGFGVQDVSTSVKQWDGSAWHDVADSLLGRVRILASDERTILAGGSFPLANLDRWASVMEWNGSAWLPLGLETLQSRSNVLGLAMLEGVPIAVGWIRSASLPSGSPIARWDGDDWKPMGGGISGVGLVSTVYRGQLVLGGRLTIDGRPVDLVRWDGSQWVEFPGAPVWDRRPLMDGKEFIDLQVIGDELYVVGLASVDGRRVNSISRWDGHQWHDLGSGVSPGVVYAQGSLLEAFAGDLYVAGALTVAGDKSSFHIARWTPEKSSPGHSADRQGSARPATEHAASIEFDLAAPARIVVEIFDLQGRRVAKPVDAFANAGIHSFTWDGRGADGSPMPAGLYFARRRVAGEAVAATRIVLAR